MSNAIIPEFDHADLGSALAAMNEADLDELNFGVIGFDAATVVKLYNSYESRCAGLSRGRVVGQCLFTIVAPCMNNFMVAQRFDDAQTNGTTLDDTIDYVLTLRMRPIKVRLRLVASPDSAMRYVLVYRPA